MFSALGLDLGALEDGNVGLVGSSIVKVTVYPATPYCYHAEEAATIDLVYVINQSDVYIRRTAVGATDVDIYSSDSVSGDVYLGNLGTDVFTIAYDFTSTCTVYGCTLKALNSDQ